MARFTPNLMGGRWVNDVVCHIGRYNCENDEQCTVSTATVKDLNVDGGRYATARNYVTHSKNHISTDTKNTGTRCAPSF